MSIKKIWTSCFIIYLSHKVRLVVLLDSILMKKPHLIFQLDPIFCSVWLRLRLRLLRATDTRHFKWFTPTDIKSQHRSKLVPVQWSDQILSAVCWSGTFDNTPPNSRNYNSENTNGEFVFFGTFDKIFIFQQYSYVYVRTTINQKEIWRLNPSSIGRKIHKLWPGGPFKSPCTDWVNELIAIQHLVT